MIKILYALAGVMVGMLSLKGYALANEHATLVKNAKGAIEMAEINQKLIDQCLAVLDKCKTVAEEQNTKYEVVVDQYDKLSQSCFSNNFKLKTKLVSRDQGQGGPAPGSTDAGRIP